MGGLLSVFNEQEGISEFEHMFEVWTNPEALFEFFQAHQKDLSSSTTEEAVNRTIEDALALEDRFLDTVENDTEQLQTLFKPLSNNQFRLAGFQRSKAYGELRRSWLRVYAIRVDEDNYIVTGGAIKLTRTMQDRPHTNDQLRRLTRMRDYLIENGFDDRDIEDLEA
ncbi:MAG: hypothetical protein WEA36_05955 [Balneolaceae bacterium]